MILWTKLIIHFHEVMLALSRVLSRQNQLRVLGYNLQNFVRKLGRSTTCYTCKYILLQGHMLSTSNDDEKADIVCLLIKIMMMKMITATMVNSGK